MAQRKTTRPRVPPRAWYLRSCAVWLGELRDFLLEYRDLGIALTPMQTDVLRDVEQESHEWPRTVAPLLDFRLWDLPRLRERDPKVAMPKLDLQYEITKKDNLSVRWYPSGWNEFASPHDHDFLAWQQHYRLNDYEAAYQRPNNELMFLRGVGRLWIREDGWSDAYLCEANRLLLFASRALVAELESFLRQFFEVSTLSAFDFTVDRDGAVIEWTIVDADELWVRDFEKRMQGVPIQLFCRLFRSVEGDDAAIAKQLRGEGFSKITAREVRPESARFREYSGWGRFRQRHLALIDDNVGQVVAFRTRKPASTS